MHRHTAQHIFLRVHQIILKKVRLAQINAAEVQVKPQPARMRIVRIFCLTFSPPVYVRLKYGPSDSLVLPVYC